ncbi:hypothetical protein M758_6G078900 [Ceratodon purpureus]|nr:hypothetical protein M758_6G078900 [Ceratodon purpureus]KAG0613125.1 hypothetical protein M758_6G078900 [Ceratodon purpureus]KAG0613126.1 hypothetical protein M758_6G078900 [Ceratodon purpureus]KAG0613127.1 hypothetical protein M758_6G078900 [Ceratodon purpureus]KAG0613128.1 hypothetical protein M758_6G078900 [Ceratodon purpureus]
MADVCVVLPFHFGTATLVIIVASMFWLWKYRWQQRDRLEPKQWPILGSGVEIATHFDTMHDWLLSYFLKGLKTFRVVLPGIVYTYTVDPANVEYILKTNFSNFPKGEVYQKNMETLLGHGIFNSDGEVWRQQRKTASLEFANRILREYSTVAFRENSIMLAEILARACQSHEAIEMQDLFMRFTLDGICKVGFGVTIGTLSSSLPVPFMKEFDNASEAVIYRFFDPFWKLKKLLNIGNEAKLADSVKVLDDFSYKVIKTRREELQFTNAQGKETKADLLSRFILLGEDSAQNFTDKTLRDIILNFIIAGRDTTAVTLSWFVYLLGNNPDVADKIYEELHLLEKGVNVNESLPLNEKINQYSSLLSYDVLSKLQYLHAAITETIRLYPAVPQNPKGILADDILPDGTVLKKGGLVSYVPYAQARMTDVWGADANEFRPERWLKDGMFIPESPFKFNAFQAGPRICLGKDSAYLQMKMVAAVLCHFFKFQLVPGHPVKYRMTATLVMNQGVQVFVTRR